MKKLNVNLYQGNPEEVITKDNNNIFVEGDIEYSTGRGTKINSISSIKDSEGKELASGGGGSEIDEFIEEKNIEYEITGGKIYGVLSSNYYLVSEYKDYEYAVFEINNGKYGDKKTFANNFVYFHVGDEFQFSGDKEDYNIIMIDDYKGEDLTEDGESTGVEVPSEYFQVSPV